MSKSPSDSENRVSADAIVTSENVRIMSANKTGQPEKATDPTCGCVDRLYAHANALAQSGDPDGALWFDRAGHYLNPRAQRSSDARDLMPVPATPADVNSRLAAAAPIDTQTGERMTHLKNRGPVNEDIAEALAAVGGFMCAQCHAFGSRSIDIGHKDGCPFRIPRSADDPTCDCEKVDRCVRDLCLKCCYCGAAIGDRAQLAPRPAEDCPHEPACVEDGECDPHRQPLRSDKAATLTLTHDEAQRIREIIMGDARGDRCKPAFAKLEAFVLAKWDADEQRPSEATTLGNDVVCGDHWAGLSGQPINGSEGCPWCHVETLERDKYRVESSLGLAAQERDRLRAVVDAAMMMYAACPADPDATQKYEAAVDTFVDALAAAGLRMPASLPAPNAPSPAHVSAEATSGARCVACGKPTKYAVPTPAGVKPVCKRSTVCEEKARGSAVHAPDDVNWARTFIGDIEEALSEQHSVDLPVASLFYERLIARLTESRRERAIPTDDDDMVIRIFDALAAGAHLKPEAYNRDRPAVEALLRAYVREIREST